MYRRNTTNMSCSSPPSVRQIILYKYVDVLHQFKNCNEFYLQGSFGDQLLCPVCFEMFEGRILQCSQGHSVCEECHLHLNNECPQCRGPFVGTRNYVLEEVVKQLKHLKATVMVKKTNIARGNDANANTVASDANSDSEDTDVVIDNVKLTKAMATLVASIPKPSKRQTTMAPERSGSPAPAHATATASPDLGNCKY